MATGPRCPVQAGPGQRDGVDLVAIAMQSDLAGAGGDGQVLDVQAGAFLGSRPGVQQYRDDGGITEPRQAASRRSAASCRRVSASGSPGLGMRTRLAALDGAGRPDLRFNAGKSVHGGLCSKRSTVTLKPPTQSCPRHVHAFGGRVPAHHRFCMTGQCGLRTRPRQSQGSPSRAQPASHSPPQFRLPRPARRQGNTP